MGTWHRCCNTTHNSDNPLAMKITRCEIYGQFYVLPAIKVTYDKLLNGDKEIILCWLKWELILAL